MSSTINPNHYKRIIHVEHDEDGNAQVQVVDIMEAFFMDDMHLSHACKYFLRAGKKDPTKRNEDLNKALWWIMRSIVDDGGKIELPDFIKDHLLAI